MAHKLARYERVSDKEEGASSSSNNNSALSKSVSPPKSPTGGESNGGAATGTSKEPTFFEIIRVLRPYFWPNSGSDGAFLNRVRALSTWGAVILSKVCNLLAPVFLAAATNYLTDNKFPNAVANLIIYACLRVGSSFFKEMQSIIYVKVKQQASIELQVLTFAHLHTLSLNWHLSKKTGSVMKSMDRGIEAVGQLITYLFLFLIPAFCECIAVVILFFVQFKQWGLGALVFAGVLLYSIATICT
jgi:ABC-type multidrug transport system fused ATPase/permease subunit